MACGSRTDQAGRRVDPATKRVDGTSVRERMIQYIYSPAEAGVASWPEGLFRLECEATTNPDEADVFVCPGNLALFQSGNDLKRLPFYAGRESRHVFGCIDESEVIYDTE